MLYKEKEFTLVHDLMALKFGESTNMMPSILASDENHMLCQNMTEDQKDRWVYAEDRENKGQTALMIQTPVPQERCCSSYGVNHPSKIPLPRTQQLNFNMTRTNLIHTTGKANQR